MSNGDYGYFGKGDTGYAQYMTAFNRNFGGSSGGGGGGGNHNNNGGGDGSGCGCLIAIAVVVVIAVCHCVFLHPKCVLLLLRSFY